MFTIPKSQAMSLRGTSDQPFAAGTWRGVFENFEVRGLPEFAGNEKSGYQSTDGDELSVQIGQNHYSDTVPDGVEAPDVGNRKFFLNLTLRDGDLAVETVDVTARKAPYWRLQRSARLIANLAVALGWADETADGNLIIQEGFIAALTDGTFRDQPIAFTIYHRSFKRTDPSDPTGRRQVTAVSDEIETFLAAE